MPQKYIDAQGNEVNIEEIPKKKVSAFDPESLNIKSLVPYDQQIRNWKQLLNQIIEVFGRQFGVPTASALASYYGGPLAGIATGAGLDIGIQAGQELAGLKRRPSMLSSFIKLHPAADIPIATAEDLALIGAAGKGAEIASQTIGPIRRAMLATMKPAKPDYRIFTRFPEIPASYSQMSGSQIARAVEEIGAPFASTKQREQAIQAGRNLGIRVLGDISGRPVFDFEDPFKYTDIFRLNLKKHLAALRTQSAYEASKAGNIAKANTVTQMVIMPNGAPFPQVAEGPILLKRAIAIADQILKEEMQKYGVQSTGQLINIVEAEKRPAIATLNEIMKYNTKDMHGNPILTPFQAAWELKQAAANLGWKREAVTPTYKESIFRKLSRAIDEDILESMDGWVTEGAKAKESYLKAKALVQKRINLFEFGDDIQRILQEESHTGSDYFRRLLNDPRSIGRAIAAGQDRKNLGAFKLNEVLSNAWDFENERFNPSKLYDSWFRPEIRPILKKLYNKEQLDYLDDFIKVLVRTNQPPLMTGKVAAFVRFGSAFTYVLGATLLGGIVGGAIPTSTGMIQASSLVAAGIGLNTFAKRVLLNPKVARIALDLLKDDKVTPETIAMGKVLLGALKGTKVLLETNEGEIIPAQIDDKGQISVK